MEKSSRSQLAVIFITVFVDLLGFGILIPLNPYIATQFGASPSQVGLLMAVYSLMQFLFSPFWGRLSDRIGRRPVMLVSILGGLVSYLGFAFATSLAWLFVARIFAGICGANISTAMAYIADITKKEDRSKSMGLIGAAFGLGFIFGPAIGGYLAAVGMRLGNTPPFGIGFPAVGAAGICFLNLVWAYFKLPETVKSGVVSVDSSSRDTMRATGLYDRFVRLTASLRRPVVGPLMIVFFLSGLAMAHMESSLGLFLKDRFGWSLTESSYGFAYVGIMMVITQGFLIRRLLPVIGERTLLVFGLSCAAFGIASISLAGLGPISYLVWLCIAMTLLSIGIGFANPSTLGSISLLSPADEQGATMGETQSLSALGRIIGPAMGGIIYQHLGERAPFVVGGLLAFLGLLIVSSIFGKIPQSGKAKGRGATAGTVAGH